MIDGAPTPATAEIPSLQAARHLLARHLVGSGVELGPGHAPFAVFKAGTSVRYIDRWRPTENRDLFPELVDATFVEPDIIADFNVDRLGALEDASQDFVICSHVLEHVAEPIGLIADIHRVLRGGGIALILLPDRHRTFDRTRKPTSLEHLVAEFHAGVTDVDSAHLKEFFEHVGEPFGNSEADHVTNTKRHLDRSIHVHCWDHDDFVPVLLYAIRELGQRWEFVDGVIADDDGPTGMEFGFVLRVCTTEVSQDALAERFAAQWQIWRTWREDKARIARELDECRAHRDEKQQELTLLQSRFDTINRRLPLRAYRFVRRLLPRR